MFDLELIHLPPAFLGIGFGAVVNFFIGAAISVAASLVSSLFIKKPDQRAPRVAGYPIQHSQKAIAIPKIYGCCRVAGNVIWMGEQQQYEKKKHQPGVDGHVLELTYFKSFTIGIAEGAGAITKIWNGKRLIWSSAEGVVLPERPTLPEDFNPGGIMGLFFKSEIEWKNDTQEITVGPASSAPESPPDGSLRVCFGDGTQDARFYTGEVFGKYDDLIWVHFTNFVTGPTPNIPNFSFEVCTGNTYQYTYISDNGSITGIPLFGTTATGLDAGEAAVDIGGGVVSLPWTGHPFKVGNTVTLKGSTNYEGSHTLLDSTTRDALHITSVYNAEVFDGTEIVCRTIGPIAASNARMVVDGSGNVWLGTNFANGTCVVRIEPDGTIVNDALTNTWGGADSCFGLQISSDRLFLYVLAGGQVDKFDLATGLPVWTKTANNSLWQMAIDADDNVYVGFSTRTKDAIKYASADGTETSLPGFGSVVDADKQGNAAGDTIITDDSLGIVLGGGRQFLTAGTTGALYNLVVALQDGTKIAKLALGGFNVSSTWFIRTNNIRTYAGFIYVLSYTPTATLYKIRYDSDAQTLTVITSAAVGTDAEGFWFDSSGNLVVMADAADANRLWFFDVDLTFISKLANLRAAMGVSWAVATWISGNHERYLGGGFAGRFDENPATMIEDLATQDRYGAGIASQYINFASVTEQQTFWEMEENRIAIAMTEQLPLMDWVDFILSHCNGYRHWSEGQLHLGAFKDKASIVSLDQDDLVREKGENPPPPVQVVKRKPTETSNLIELSWIDRENTYDLSVSIAKDDVDRRVSGKVRINPADLTGIKRKELAVKQAYRLLFEGMYRFSIYSFEVGYKNMLYTVGDMIDLSDGGQLVNERMLIIAREEDKDGRSIRIEAVEDISGLYPDIAYETEQTLAVPDVPTGSDDLVTGTLSFREHATAPNLYLFFAPGDSVTTGAFIYRSFDNILYEFVGRVAFDKDTLPNSVGTTSSVMPRAKAVIHRRIESVTVDIGEITSLRTDVSDDEFFQNQSLIKIGDEIMAFKTAEDQGSGVWKLTQTIRGLFGTEAVAHPVGSTFATVSLIDLFYELSDEVAGQVIYFKALATAPFNVSQTLENVGDATEYTVIREHQRPYPLSIQGVKDAGGLCTVDSFPVTMEFNLASKEAGYNLGGFGEVPWGNFVKDGRIVGINVTLKTIGGVEIVFEYHSLEGYHASQYELTVFNVDRLMNDPFIVEMQPVTSLPSSKVTANMIDVVT